MFVGIGDIVAYSGEIRRVVALAVTSYDWEGPTLRDRIDPPAEYVVVETQRVYFDVDRALWCIPSAEVLPPVPYAV